MVELKSEKLREYLIEAWSEGYKAGACSTEERSGIICNEYVNSLVKDLELNKRIFDIQQIGIKTWRIVYVADDSRVGSVGLVGESYVAYDRNYEYLGRCRTFREAAYLVKGGI